VPLGDAARERLCEAGEVPPAVAENVSAVGLTVKVAAGFTVKVTGMVTVCPLPVTTTEPEKVPAARPVTAEDTVSVAGVVPDEGETVNHDPPLALAV